jgi:hypothetical protein
LVARWLIHCFWQKASFLQLPWFILGFTGAMLVNTFALGGPRTMAQEAGMCQAHHHAVFIEAGCHGGGKPARPFVLGGAVAGHSRPWRWMIPTPCSPGQRYGHQARPGPSGPGRRRRRCFPENPAPPGAAHGGVARRAAPPIVGPAYWRDTFNASRRGWA